MTSLRKHLRVALKDAAKKRPLVAYIGAASGDHPGFFKMIGAEIIRAGGRPVAAKLCAKGAKASTARGVLEDSDVVFVSGGDVLAGMSVLSDRDMIPLFHALAEVGRPMIGISAGSLMLAREWVHFPEGEAAPHLGAHAVLFPCLGLAPVYVDAHAEADGWDELRVLLALLAARGDAHPVGYGLTRKGALRVDPTDGGVTLTALGTATPRYVVQRKRVVEGAPLPLGAEERVRLSKPAARRSRSKG